MDTASVKRGMMRKELWEILQHGRGPTGHAYNLATVVLVLLSLAILPLEFVPMFFRYHSFLFLLELCITVLFTVECFLRLFAAPNRIKHLFSFWGVVDILSIVPSYLHLLLGLDFLRVLRIVRILKFVGIEAPGAEDERKTMQESVGLLEGEAVEYVVSHHPIFLLAGCLPPLLASSASVAIILFADWHPFAVAAGSSLVIFSIIFLWKSWLDFGYDVIYVTTHRLIFQNQHLLGRSVNQVNYFAITNVKPSYASILSYILRYGTVVIETQSDARGRIELRSVRNHEHAARIIMQHCFTARQSYQDAQGK